MFSDFALIEGQVRVFMMQNARFYNLCTVRSWANVIDYSKWSSKLCNEIKEVEHFTLAAILDLFLNDISNTSEQKITNNTSEDSPLNALSFDILHNMTFGVFTIAISFQSDLHCVNTSISERLKIRIFSQLQSLSFGSK